MKRLKARLGRDPVTRFRIAFFFIYDLAKTLPDDFQ